MRIFRSLHDRLKRRRKAVVAASVAAVVAGLVTLTGTLVLPALRARLGVPLEDVVREDPSLPGGRRLRNNSLEDENSRKFLENDSLEAIESARQLSQAVITTIRNFYVDEERVTDLQIAQKFKKVLARHLPKAAVTLEERILVLLYAGKKLKYPLSRTGLVESITAASVLLAEERSKASNVGKNLDRKPDGKSSYSSLGIGAGENIARLDSTGSARLILNALVSELDPHSSVMSPHAYNELRQGTEGSFGGLGVLVGIRDRVLTVIKPLSKSPALRAGILPGDKIIRINNQPTYGMALENLMEFMRGVPGTHVTMRILRSGEQSPFDAVIKREVIQVDSVTSSRIEVGALNIQHVVVETFSAKTSREILSAMKAFKQEYKAIDGLILDLRANPGGLLDQAIQVADLFLEDGVIVSTRGRREEVEIAGKGYDEVDFPLVVLLDEDSASASEIVAGALQDHGRAIVVGRPSFGKGSVQTVFELPFEIALKLTIARYFTPDEKSIQNVGILPDVWLQPVSEKNQNRNLLGGARYRNEGFLLHHLDTFSSGDDHLAMIDQKLTQPCCNKAYYLEAPEADEKSDPDLDVAKSIVKAVLAENQGGSESRRRWRTTAWDSLDTSVIVETLVKSSFVKAGKWLESTFSVKWSENNTAGSYSSLEGEKSPAVFEVQNLSGTDVKTGSDARFLWTIRNGFKRPLHRISVYARGSGLEGDTTEILVGSIPAGESRSGEIVLAAPNEGSEPLWNVDVGVAMDAWPVSRLVQPFVFELKPSEKVEVQCRASFQDEGSSMKNGTLDPGESGVLRVIVGNYGTAPADELSVAVTNLGGDRISVENDQNAKLTLKSGEERVLDVPVTLEGSYAAEEIDFGIAVEWKGMKAPIYKSVTIPLSPVGGRIGELMIETPR